MNGMRTIVMHQSSIPLSLGVGVNVVGCREYPAGSLSILHLANTEPTRGLNPVFCQERNQLKALVEYIPTERVRVEWNSKTKRKIKYIARRPVESQDDFAERAQKRFMTPDCNLL